MLLSGLPGAPGRHSLPMVSVLSPVPAPFPSIPALPCRLASQIPPALNSIVNPEGGKCNFNSGNRLSPCSASATFKPLSSEPPAHQGQALGCLETTGLGEGSQGREEGPQQSEISASCQCWAVSRHTPAPSVCACSRECCCSLPAAAEELMELAVLHWGLFGSL